MATRQLSSGATVDDLNNGAILVEGPGPFGTSSGTIAHLEFDYLSRTDAKPVYFGKAPAAALITDTTWTIKKFNYDSSARIIEVDVRTFMQWTNRTSPTPPWSF